MLMLGWGSTFGPIREAVKQLRAKGKNVSHIHLRYLNPLPSDLGDKLRTFKQGDGRRDEHGTTAQDGARGLPGRRDRLQQGPGPSVQGQRTDNRILRALEG